MNKKKKKKRIPEKVKRHGRNKAQPHGLDDSWQRDHLIMILQQQTQQEKLLLLSLARAKRKGNAVFFFIIIIFLFHRSFLEDIQNFVASSCA